jgi:hypothetical protein
MRADDAALWLAGRRQDLVTAEHQSRAERYRTAVTSRPPFGDQLEVLADLPPSLSDHSEQFWQQPSAQPFVAEGWQIKMANLNKVIAIQPQVFTDHAAQRLEGVDITGLGALASVAIPVGAPTPLAVQFDEGKKLWTFSSSNPNLRIAGHFSSQVQPGLNAFGFLVTISPSFIQVVAYRNRYILRDGYHRSVELVRRGAAQVPVLFRESETFTQLGLPPGLLDQDVFLGDRPPFLGDYLDDSVAAEVEIPATLKVVAVEGLEFGTVGEAV